MNKILKIDKYTFEELKELVFNSGHSVAHVVEIIKEDGENLKIALSRLKDQIFDLAVRAKLNE